MANITLAEAVKLKSILRKRIQELELEMYRVAYNHEKYKQVRQFLHRAKFLT